MGLSTKSLLLSVGTKMRKGKGDRHDRHKTNSSPLKPPKNASSARGREPESRARRRISLWAPRAGSDEPDLNSFRSFLAPGNGWVSCSLGHLDFRFLGPKGKPEARPIKATLRTGPYPNGRAARMRKQELARTESQYGQLDSRRCVSTQGMHAREKKKKKEFCFIRSGVSIIWVGEF